MPKKSTGFEQIELNQAYALPCEHASVALKTAAVTNAQTNWVSWLRLGLSI